MNSNIDQTNTNATSALYDYNNIDAEELLDLLVLTEAFSKALAEKIENCPATQKAFDNALDPDDGRELTTLAEAYLISHFEDMFGFEKAIDAAEAEIDPKLSRNMRIQAMIAHIQQEDIYVKFLLGENNSINPPIISLPFMCAALPPAMRSDENVALLDTIYAPNLAALARQTAPRLN